MKKIIIYGINQQAEQLYAYLTQEHVWVEAFCVDRVIIPRILYAENRLYALKITVI